MELTKAKEEAKYWFLGFIRGEHNPADAGYDDYDAFESLQNNLNAVDITFDMMEGGSQEYYMRINLPDFVDKDGQPLSFKKDEILRGIFYRSNVQDYIKPNGYRVEVNGKTAKIFFKDKLEDRQDIEKGDKI